MCVQKQWANVRVGILNGFEWCISCCKVIRPFKTTSVNGFEWQVNLFKRDTKSRRVRPKYDETCEL